MFEFFSMVLHMAFSFLFIYRNLQNPTRMFLQAPSNVALRSEVVEDARPHDAQDQTRDIRR
jgi:hypothetical protein